MDKSIANPCPGKDEEFNRRHGSSGVAIFFAVIIPIIVAAGAGYWVWRNWSSNFGQIRLGEQCKPSSVSQRSTLNAQRSTLNILITLASFSDEAPYIKYPVLVIAGVVAVAQAIPLLASSLWRSASSMFGGGGMRRFTTRDSFARGRGDYATVDNDEGELLGDESDEEV
jgi:hypothetical protein